MGSGLRRRENLRMDACVLVVDDDREIVRAIALLL